MPVVVVVVVVLDVLEVTNGCPPLPVAVVLVCMRVDDDSPPVPAVGEVEAVSLPPHAASEVTANARPETRESPRRKHGDHPLARRALPRALHRYGRPAPEVRQSARARALQVDVEVS